MNDEVNIPMFFYVVGGSIMGSCLGAVLLLAKIATALEALAGK